MENKRKTNHILNVAEGASRETTFKRLMCM